MKRRPLSILLIYLFCSSCRNEKPVDYVVAEKISREKKPDQRMTDIVGAMEYEFNMTKNPATGKIPDGIRQQELEQARSLRNTQDRTTLSTYIFQGPNNLGGRTRAVAYDVRYDGSTNRIILAGGVSGGLFKSIDDGGLWTRKSNLDDQFTVTALAQDPRAGFRDTWYYAGGEFIGNSASGVGAFHRGNGVYKSTDNGETWALLASSNTGTIEGLDHPADYVSKIVVDPTNGNVYVACIDAIRRSTDGGITWSTVLSSGSGSLSSSYITDIIVTSTGRFYAAFSGLSPTVPTNVPGVWTSTTGASASWTKIAGPTAGTSPAGWNAAGAFGRVVLAYAPSLDSRVFATYHKSTVTSCVGPVPEAELFRWDDGLSTWTDLSASVPDEAGCSIGNDPFAVQSGYDLVLAVKPDDEDVVFLGGTNIYRSTNGFTSSAATTRIGGYASTGSYALYASSHPDIHSISFSPISTTTMLCGNDGGIQRTTDDLAGTVSWTQINIGFRTYQYYDVALDPRVANEKVLGGAQDNGSTRNTGGSGVDFESVMGGDGVSVGLSDLILGVDYEYVGFQFGEIIRRDATLPSGFGTLITPIGEGGTGLFVTLFHLDQDNSNTLYYANDETLRRTTSASTVSGAGWTHLTGIAPAVGAGIDITALATSRGAYSAVTSSLFIGTSAGELFRLDDPAFVAAATAPVDITGASFPAGGYISSISVNPRNDDTVLVTFSNYGVTSVFWSGNANTATPTWTAVEGGLSLPSYRSSAIAVTSSGVEYYVGTSVGLYTAIGLPGVVSWSQDGAGEIGNAVVSNLVLRPADNKLLVGTHGYGMWYTMLSMASLPVTLVNFEGKWQEQDVLLNWTTSFESMSSKFEIEKSYNGNNFFNLTSKPAAGNSTTTRGYNHLDKTHMKAENYYRLKMIDLDGKFDYSPIIRLTKNEGPLFTIFDNPVKNELNIQFHRPLPKQATMILTDLLGRRTIQWELAKGVQSIQKQLPATLRSGTYIVSVWLGESRHSEMVLIE
jgi:hypothetical protein